MIFCVDREHEEVGKSLAKKISKSSHGEVVLLTGKEFRLLKHVIILPSGKKQTLTVDRDSIRDAIRKSIDDKLWS